MGMGARLGVVLGWGCLVVCAAGTSCGGKSASDASASGGMSNSSTGGGAARASAGACAAAPPPTPPPFPGAPPASFACAVFTDGTWQDRPCGCELWLKNPVTAPLRVALSLAFEPADSVPSLAGPLDVEMSFDDADASWYGVWAHQVDNGTRFVVTNADGKTRVRLGANSVALSAVSLAGCAFLKPTATVTGPLGVFLDLQMQATLTDSAGQLAASSTGECFQPAEHPTTSGLGGGSDAGADSGVGSAPPK